MLVSSVQQSDSVICTHVSTLFQIILPLCSILCNNLSEPKAFLRDTSSLKWHDFQTIFSYLSWKFLLYWIVLQCKSYFFIWLNLLAFVLIVIWILTYETFVTHHKISPCFLLDLYFLFFLYLQTQTSWNLFCIKYQKWTHFYLFSLWVTSYPKTIH